MKRYFFTRDILSPYKDIKIIETYKDYDDIHYPVGYTLISITKI
jgi:hypothetical protein